MGWNPEAMREDSTWVPMHLREGFTLYVEMGVPTGSGMRSILENQPLADVIGRLDSTAEAHVGHIVRFIYNHTPASCWGSPEKVSAWVAQGGLKGRAPAPDSQGDDQ